MIQQKAVGNYSLRSQSYYYLHVPPARTNLGKTAFKYAAPSEWNSLQMKLRLNHLVSFSNFKRLMHALEKYLGIYKGCTFNVNLALTNYEMIRQGVVQRGQQ